MTSDAIQALLRPFYGYLELGMDADANDSLEALPDDVKPHPLVLTAQLELLMVMKRWEDGVILGQSLCRIFSNHHDLWFRTAYCLHAMKRTAEAKETLLSAPTAISGTALYCYNLACYEAQLGRIDRAKSLLEACFTKDANMRATALDDPDLEQVWDSIARE
ncbi:MAG: hypothetical protein WDO13_18175 [Verrucomicrobiota bacterium]